MAYFQQLLEAAEQGVLQAPMAQRGVAVAGAVLQPGGAVAAQVGPKDGPGLAVVGGVVVGHARRQPEQVAAADPVFAPGLALAHAQQALAFAAIDQQVLVVALAAHAVVAGAPVMAQGGGIEVAAERVDRQFLQQRRRDRQAQAVGRQGPVGGVRHVGSRLRNIVHEQHNLVDLATFRPVIASWPKRGPNRPRTSPPQQ